MGPDLSIDGEGRAGVMIFMVIAYGASLTFFVVPP